MEKRLEGTLTITRTHGGDDQTINIRFEDRASGIEFASIVVSLEGFAKAITGLAFVEGELKVNRLGAVGKKYEHKKDKRFIGDYEYERLMDGVGYDDQKNRLAGWLKEWHSEEGWEIQNYLGSRGNIERDYQSGGWWLNFTRFRYVDVA